MSHFHKKKHQPQRPTRYTILLSKVDGQEKFILKSDDPSKEIVAVPGQPSPLGSYNPNNPRYTVDYALRKAAQLSSIPIEKIWLSRELDERLETLGVVPTNDCSRGNPLGLNYEEPPPVTFPRYGLEFLYKAKGTVFSRVPDEILVNDQEFYFDPEKVSLAVEEKGRLVLYLDDANIQKIEIPQVPK
jgi:hypothetical protein